WVFAYNSWTETDSLTWRRSMHRAIPLPDGRVMLIGGAEEGGSFAPAMGSPVVCTEVFDPDDLSFATIGPCTTRGSGANPTVSWSNGDGGFVLSGQYSVGSNGGDEYVFIGFGPEHL
ncbi:MAG: hypothetical protein HN348_16875, partial [Proteobacteria bacterium]|nr:hypothetical protein [Pseudomonadota bacterium]